MILKTLFRYVPATGRHCRLILQVNSAKNLKEGKTHMGHGPDTYVTVTCGQESFVSDTAMQVRKGILKPLI